MDNRERNEEVSGQQKPPETQMAAAEHRQQPPPPQKCPRCDSSNTKFCYYNNYSLSQPRYFCKSCRRYWTQGGTLRNVPVGGGCRRTKRPKTSSSAADPPPSTSSGQPRPLLPPRDAPMGGYFQGGGGFLSSLAAVQSLRGGGAAAANFGGQFGANMALLQGMRFPPSKAPAAVDYEFQPRNYFFPSEQRFVPARPFNSWTQSLINTGGGGSGGGGGDGSDRTAGSQLNPNQWSENYPGFNHHSQ